MVVATATIGSALIVNGLDTLVKPGGKNHINAELKPSMLQNDHWLQAELSAVLVLIVSGTIVQWYCIVRREQRKQRQLQNGPSMPLLAGSAPMIWQSHPATGRFLQHERVVAPTGTRPRGHSLTRGDQTTPRSW